MERNNGPEGYRWVILSSVYLSIGLGHLFWTFWKNGASLGSGGLAFIFLSIFFLLTAVSIVWARRRPKRLAIKQFFQK